MKDLMEAKMEKGRKDDGSLVVYVSMCVCLWMIGKKRRGKVCGQKWEFFAGIMIATHTHTWRERDGHIKTGQETDTE